MKEEQVKSDLGGGITVLALLEGNPSDLAVAEQAADLVRRSGGQLLLLRTLPVIHESLHRAGAPPIEPWQQMEAKAAHARRGLRALKKKVGVKARVLVEFGNRVESVAQATAGQEVDLVVAAVPKPRRLPWLKRDFRLLAGISVPITMVSPKAGPSPVAHLPVPPLN